jgi:hypothetical protein
MNMIPNHFHNFSKPSDNAKLEASNGQQLDCAHCYRDSNPIADTTPGKYKQEVKGKGKAIPVTGRGGP